MMFILPGWHYAEIRAKRLGPHTMPVEHAVLWIRFGSQTGDTRESGHGAIRPPDLSEQVIR